MQPLKSEFPQFVQFTENISDRMLTFQIYQAYDKTLRSKFGDLIETIYDGEAETLATDKPELVAFYNSYLLEYWILAAYRRFISTHGTNVTQFGLTRTKDPEGTFDAVAGDDRAVMIRQISSDMSVIETRIYRRLTELQWTFDGIVYVSPDPDNKRSTPTKNFGISAIGAGPDRGDDCDDEAYFRNMHR